MKERSVTTDITDAMFELLKSKELPQITVTELIKKAGVCRASFYRNFYLTEDVIRQYGIAMYEEINRKLPIVPGEIREHILAVTIHLWTQRERLALIEKRGLFYLLEDPMMTQCMYQIQYLGVQRNRYQAAFYGGATQRVLCTWIKNGFSEPPQEITRILYELLAWNPLGNADR